MNKFWAEGIVEDVLFDELQIQEAVEGLAAKITEDYRGKELIVAGILRGAFLFVADLVRKIELPLEVDFIAVSSYGSATKSSGVVRIMKDLSLAIEGKHVLVCEDVVDTGLTWAYLRDVLQARRPESLKMCSLLDKPSARKNDVRVDYAGFVIEDQFVAGYGLDLKERYRNLPFVFTPTAAARPK